MTYFLFLRISRICVQIGEVVFRAYSSRFMGAIGYLQTLKKGFKIALSLGVLLLGGCQGFQKVDFQEERCKQAPAGNIAATKGENLRWEFGLTATSGTVETESIRVVWTIEGRAFAAQRVSYQFDKRGAQKITVVMTNRCLMQTSKETTITVN